LTLTGNGMKDPDTAIAQCQSAQGDVEKARMLTIDANLDSVRSAILGFM